MHDMAMAQSIVKNILDVAGEEKARSISKIELEIGEFNFVSPDQIRFWLKEGLKDSPAAEAKIYIKTIRTTISCKSCGYKGQIKLKEDPAAGHHHDLPVFPCPKCKKTDIDVIRGKECIIKSIEVEK